jgi:hypothetical protein
MRAIWKQLLDEPNIIIEAEYIRQLPLIGDLSPREKQGIRLNEFSNVTAGDPKAFDDPWYHRRNGSKLIGTLRDTRRKKSSIENHGGTKKEKVMVAIRN